MAEFTIEGVDLTIPDAHLTDGLRKQLAGGSYEWAEGKALGEVLHWGDRLLDLGSAVGYVACRAARILRARDITCVEANPDLIPVLEGNLKRNGAEEAGVIHGAVVPQGHAEDAVTFNLAPAFYSSSLTGSGEGARAVTVPALKLPDLLTAFEPDVITMDLEGAEAAITQQPWPGMVRVVVMEIHTKFYGLAVVNEIFAGMARNGFAYQPKGSRRDVVVFQRIGTE